MLCCIRKHPCDLKTFVASRVYEIQNHSDINSLCHFESWDDTADRMSQAAHSEKLRYENLLWNTPQFITRKLGHFSSTFEFTQNDNGLY